MTSPAAVLLADLDAVFGRLGLSWYVFGAQAVLLYGRPRLTEDVDVTVALGQLPHSSLVEELVAAGFNLDPVADDAFITATRVLPFMHSPSGMALDVVLAGPGLEEIFLAGAVVHQLGGVSVPVIRAAHLVVTKILAGRAKDLEDVRTVVQAQGADLPIEEIRDLLAQLEEGLSRTDLLPVLEGLLATKW